MKRQACSFAAAICAAALVLGGCGNKVGSAENNGTINIDDMQAAATTAAADDAAAEKPTERIKDIQSDDDYKYEVLDGCAVITGYTGTAVNVEVPSELGGVSVTKIGNHAFEGKYKIKKIKLPESITLIGQSAFGDCEGLEEINIPSGVTGIDRAAFSSCTSLTELTIPASVQYISEEAFTACESMTTLNIENPDLEYDNWGIEELADLRIYAESGSAVAKWSGAMGK